MLARQSELGKLTQQDPGADLPGPPAMPMPLNQHIYNVYITIPADTRGYIVDRLGTSTLPAAVGSEGPAEAKPRALSPGCPTARVSGRAHPHSWRPEPRAGATDSVTDAAESKGNDPPAELPAGSAAGMESRQARPGPGQGAVGAAGGSRGPCPVPRREGRSGSPVATAGRWHRAQGSVASAASSAQRTDPGLGFAAAFTPCPELSSSRRNPFW